MGCDILILWCRYEVSGYPTLKWFPADRTPQGYDGARNLDALVEFVNENSGTKRTVKGLLDATVSILDDLEWTYSGLLMWMML